MLHPPACSHLSSVGAWRLESHTSPAHSPFSFPGRNPELREDLIESFHQLALEMGIPEDSIFILANRGNLPWVMYMSCLGDGLEGERRDKCFCSMG